MMSPDALADNAALFRAITLMGEMQAAGGGMRPDIDETLDFIDALSDRATALLVEAGQRHHAIYGRIAFLTIDRILADPSCLRRLAKRLHAKGHVVELALSLRDILERPQALAECLDAVNGLHLTLPVAIAEEDVAESTRILQQILARRLSLTITADPALLKRLGLFTLADYNARYVTVLADPPQSGRPIKTPGVQSAPCRNHFRLCIDHSGDVYPCAGLTRVPAARMGSIKDRDIDALLGPRPLVDYAALARRGPNVGTPATPFDLCAEHRRLLVTLSAAPRPTPLPEAR